MSNIKKYLSDNLRGGHERFNSADGFLDDDLQFTADESFFNANGQASGNMGYSPAPMSQPYIITLTNISAVAVSNFDVLGAYQYLQNTGFSSGSLSISGVTISSAISNITYQQFLYQSMNSPFSVGMTYIESVAGSTTQVSQTITVDTRDANGNQALKTLVPTIDPYQNQSGIIAMKQPYRIDGFTKLTIASILASVTFRIHFYPADNINIARGLASRPVSRQFNSPQIVKSSVAVVGGQEVSVRNGG